MGMNLRFVRVFLSCFVMVLAAGLALSLTSATVWGQAFTADLTGVVTDPQQAVVPGVTISMKNVGNNEIRRTVTTDEGRYTFSQLLPGTYELTAELPGFKTFKQLDLVLRANQHAEVNIKMEIGEVSQTVEVVSKRLLLDTQSANQSATLDTRMVAELPMNMRTPFHFVYSLAGTTEGIFVNGTQAVFDQTFTGFGLNGGRSNSALVLLDGAPATAADWGGLMVSPSIDSVAEMQVVRNTYDAEFGKSGGGIVSLVSKSGTNTFHGTLFEFHRNDNLDANSWSNNRARRAKTEFKRHQFGGNLGGPLWKSKNLYFFGAYEGLRQLTPGSSGFRTVPTDLERAGDFSQTFNRDGSPAVIFNPFSTKPDPSKPGQFIREPFPNNKIPANLIDSVGAKVVAFYPSPNLPGDPFTKTRNFFQTAPGQVVNDKAEGRIDWVRSDKHTLFGRYTARLRQENVAACFYCNGADSEKSDNNPGFHITIGNTFTPNPTWVLNVLLGGSKWIEEQISPSEGKLTPSSIGLKDSDFHAPLLPRFNMGQYATLGVSTGSKIRKFPRYTHSLQVNATKERGAHSLKFGWMGEVAYINNVDRFSGDFSFGRGFTSGPIAATGSSTSGNEIASLLLGTPSSGITQFNADIAGALRYYGAYFQDTWRVNQRFTLVLGLRYEVQPAATERFNRLSFFDPSVSNPLGSRVGLDLKGGVRYASADDRGAWETDRSDLAPRIGIAYKLTDRLVMRAGFGIFYVPTSALITFDQPGQHIGFSTATTMVTSVGGGGLIPQDVLRNPFPNGLNQPTGSARGLETFVGEGLFQIWPAGDHPTGYKQNFSLDLQYELTPGTVVEVGYSGFRARKLVYGNPSLNANQLPSDLLKLGNALNEQVTNPFFGHIRTGFLSGRTVARHQLLRPFPQYGSIQWTRSWPGARADFDALTLKLTRQFSGGLALISSYQWSKNMDDASEDQGWAVGGGQWRDYYNRRSEYSISSHDMPHSFVTSLLYEVPVGRGRKLGADLPAVAEHVLGGWQVSSMVRLNSGFPAGPINAPNPLGAFGISQRPNLVGSPKLDKRTTDNWFNTNAFQAAPPFTIGNTARYLEDVREEALKTVDFALLKNFRTESFRVQFRADFTNLFNNPQYSSIQTFFTGGTFGRVNGVRSLQRNIQLGLKFDF